MSGSQQRWLPPIRNGILIMRQQEQQLQLQQQPSDETPVIKNMVEQIKNYPTSIMDIPDISVVMTKLKKYAFTRPLKNAIQKHIELTSSPVSAAVTVPSSKSENDIDLIQSLHKDIDLIVWTYEFYKNHVSVTIDPSAAPSSSPLQSSLSSLSYPEFINYMYESIILPTILHINAMNQSREHHSNEDSSTIMDLILCGTDIPIPSSIYDLPNVIYAALQNTKYPPSTANGTDSGAPSNVALVYINRNRTLQNNYFNSNKVYYELENMRYNMVYLHLLAHVAIAFSNTHVETPSDNNHHIPSNWKDTFTTMIQCHPLSSSQSMLYLAPVVIAMEQLDWYCHPIPPCTNETTNSYHKEETFSVFRQSPHKLVLPSIVAELVNARHLTILSEVTLFHKYVIQSVCCARLGRFPCYVNSTTSDEREIYAACYELMSFHLTEQAAYYPEVLMPLQKKQSKMQPLLEGSRGITMYTCDLTATSALPPFCVENTFPYDVHAQMFCDYNYLYERAFGLVRQVCSGFREHELSQIFSANINDTVRENGGSASDHGIVSRNDIDTLYRSIFTHMLEHSYRIIFYNRNRDSDQANLNIDYLIYMGSPPLWNAYHNTPVIVFVSVIQQFRCQVRDCATINRESKDYINLLCQQVLLRIVFIRYKRDVTNIPSEYYPHLLPPHLLSLLPSDTLLLESHTNQLYHQTSEPNYISIINDGIEKIIHEEITVPVLWFGDCKPKSMKKKLRPQHEEELDFYWMGVFSDIYHQHHNIATDESIKENSISVSAGTMSEETSRFVAYALSKSTKGMRASHNVEGPIAPLNGTNLDNDIDMKQPDNAFQIEDQHCPDVNKNDTEVFTANEKLSTIDPMDEESTDIRHDRPQTGTTTRDFDDENESMIKERTCDGENDYYETDEYEDDDDVDDDDDIEAEICDGEDAYEDSESQNQQCHNIGNNMEEAIDIDDPEEGDEYSDDYRNSPDEDKNLSDGGHQEYSENEMEVDYETESDKNVAGSGDEETDDDEIKEEEIDSVANEAYHQILLTDTASNNETIDGSQQAFEISNSVHGDDDISDDIGKKGVDAADDVDEENVDAPDEHVVNAPPITPVNEASDNSETHCNATIDNDPILRTTNDAEQNDISQQDSSAPLPAETSTIQLDINAIASLDDTTKSDVNSVVLRQNDSEALPAETSAIQLDIHALVPLDDTTKSDVNSVVLRQIDSEAGYEAEDSQDAGTDDEDNEYHQDSKMTEDTGIQLNYCPPNILAASNATNQLVVDKAVSTLIDKGYEPDTQEGPTDVDFIHHNDPEAGYDAEESQDAGTEEEEIDDHNPNIEAALEYQLPAPSVANIEPLTSSNGTAQHHENVSTLIDKGYEPDPESQSQTDVDGVPQQVRHLESGYDGEESQCHTEDEIHTEDEHPSTLPNNRSLTEARGKEIDNEPLQPQAIQPAASADGMIADDEMEAESSEVEITYGGSNVRMSNPSLEPPMNENTKMQMRTGNLLTQIATSIQNEHSYDSPVKTCSTDALDPQSKTTAQMNDYMPQIDGDDEEDDESSDSVRSKPGDEISCPMSDTHSAQSSVGMRSAAKSTESGELSQPAKNDVPISEIQTKMSVEKKKAVAKVARLVKGGSLDSEASVSDNKRVTRNAAAKSTPTKLSPVLTRKRKAALQPDQSTMDDNSNIVARKRGRTPKPPILNSTPKKEAASLSAAKSAPTTPSSVLTRKRKAALQSDQSIVDDTSSIVARKRGRPAKSPNKNEATQTAKPKEGRPPKAAKKIADSKNEPPVERRSNRLISLQSPSTQRRTRSMNTNSSR